MIEGVHLPHQVMVQGKARISHIVIGLDLHLVNPIQLLYAKISSRETVTSVRRSLLTVAWGVM